MENLFSPEAVHQLFADEHSPALQEGARRVFLKYTPPRWQFWARPRFVDVSWMFEGYSWSEQQAAVRRIPELRFQEDAVVEAMTSPHPLAKRLEKLSPYSKKNHVGPTRLFDVAHLGLLLVLGVAHFVS